MELTSVRPIAVPAALSVRSAEVFGAHVAAALADDAVRVLLLEGGTDGFCLGMDIGSLPVRGGDANDVGRSISLFAESLCLLADGPKPLVALVSGPALGGGLGIAAACDIVVAARSATFGLPEGLFGLAPAVIAPILLERISASSLRRLALTAEPVSSDEAKAIGLADEVVDDGGLATRGRRLCATLSRAHPRTRRAVSDTIRRARREPLAAAVRSGVEETTRAAQSAEVAERIARFLEGRAPWSA